MGGGVAIFVREGNEMKLTPDGRRIVQQAREILESVDKLESMFADTDDLERPLNVAIGVNFIAGISRETDQYFAEHAESMRLSELSPLDGYRSVLAGENDVAFMMCMTRAYSELKTVELARSQTYVLASKDSRLAKKRGVRTSDLKGQKILIMSAPPFQYEPLFDSLDEAGFDRTNATVIPSTSTMVHLVKWRNAIGFVSKRFALNPPPGTVAIPILDSSADWHFTAMYRRDSENAETICRVVEEIRQTFEKSDEFEDESARRFDCVS